jgi:hypothetical protein
LNIKRRSGKHDCMLMSSHLNAGQNIIVNLRFSDNVTNYRYLETTAPNQHFISDSKSRLN